MQRVPGTPQPAFSNRDSAPRKRELLRALSAAIVIIAAVALCERTTHLDVTPVSLILMAVVVGIGLRLGRVEGLAAAIAAPLALNYFFPPSRGFSIEAPGHAVVFLTFLVTAAGVVQANGRAAEKKMEAEVLRKSGDIKSAVFSALAHEARSPLGSIKIAASTLRSICSEASGEQELAGIIIEEVDRMDRWLDEASHLTQIEAPEFPLHTARHDIRGLVSSALEELGPHLAGRRIDVEIAEAVPEAECDPEMVERVLHLLLDNAVKYSPARSPISIGSAFYGDEIVVSVRDAGPGVPEGDKARIFEKHYRGLFHRSTVPGTGMGLASAKSLVECQGGEIWVTDRLGGGAAFHFSLRPAIRVAV